MIMEDIPYTVHIQWETQQLIFALELPNRLIPPYRELQSISMPY